MTGDRHKSKEKRSKKREVTALHDRTGGVWQRVIDARFCLFCFATRTWLVDEWAVIDDVNTLQCSILSLVRTWRHIVERCGILNRNTNVLAALKCDKREPSATKTNCEKFPMKTRNSRETFETLDADSLRHFDVIILKIRHVRPGGTCKPSDDVKRRRCCLANKTSQDWRIISE